MRERRIVVLDDYFPRLETGFRVAEFTWLLDQAIVATVMSSATPFDEVAAPYRDRYPEVAARVVRYDAAQFGAFDLAYLLFVNNAIAYLPDLAAAKLPFVLTLYPGGGLNIDTKEGIGALHKIFESGLVRHVITTQPRISEFVREHFASISPVTEVIGLVVNPILLRPGPGQRTSYFGSGKKHLDVCFVSYKYSWRGADKGYPQFLNVVRGLKFAGVPVRAHVVGGFDADDLPVQDLGDDIAFHPPLATAELRQFFLGMDVIVSPNRPGILGEGAFDGFPTGAVIEAALSGVAMLCSDELGQNRLFRNGRSILIERPEEDAMARRLLRLFAEPGGLRRVAQAGLQVARQHYSIDAQMEPRVYAMQSAILRRSSTA